MTRLATLAVVVLLAGSACGGSGTAHGGSGVVTAGGRIGSLQIDTSTRAAVVAFAGKPDVDITGDRADASIYETPRPYRALGYGCSHDQSVGMDPGTPRPAHRNCRTIYFINSHTHRLGAFFTDSADFHTVNGTSPGMSQADAVQREHRKLNRIAYSTFGIWRPSARTFLFLPLTCKLTKSRCLGGDVAVIELESRHHDVHLLFG